MDELRGKKSCVAYPSLCCVITDAVRKTPVGECTQTHVLQAAPSPGRVRRQRLAGNPAQTQSARGPVSARWVSGPSADRVVELSSVCASVPSRSPESAALPKKLPWSPGTNGPKPCERPELQRFHRPFFSRRCWRFSAHPHFLLLTSHRIAPRRQPAPSSTRLQRDRLSP